MEAKDVWRDDAYNYTGQTLDYAVKMNGVVVKKGHASAKDFPITIYLNRLAVDYLEVDCHNSVGFAYEEWSGDTRILGQFRNMPDAAAQFTLVRIEGDTEVETLYDVVYVDTSRGELKTYLSEPINGHACTQQVLPYTVYGGWSGDTPEPPEPPEPPGPPIPDSGYAKDYLTFVAREDSVWSARTYGMSSLAYSLDEGETWVDLPAAQYPNYWTSATTEWHNFEVLSGQTIMWKGTPKPVSRDVGMTNKLNFSWRNNYFSNSFYDVRGNILSVYYGDLFRWYDSLPSPMDWGDISGYTLSAGMFGSDWEDYYVGPNYDINYNSKPLNGVISAKDLFFPPVTTIGCFNGTFNGSVYSGGIGNLAGSSVEIPPVLPATQAEHSCYQSMFLNCSNLRYAPALPATTLAVGCYAGMFAGCWSLTTPPALPATTLAEACYGDMFEGCINLKTSPVLPATTLAVGCYAGMFEGCTSLTTPPELPATTLAVSCYESMFAGCTSLTTAPELPVTTLEEGCYKSMFSGCTSLTTAPELPATVLKKFCYEYMFADCTNLTKAPDLLSPLGYGAGAEDCYSYMFLNCPSLSSVKCLAQTTGSYYTFRWLDSDNGVPMSETGVFIKAAGVTWPTGVSGIPNGWRILNA